jgi:hypothetical protein
VILTAIALLTALAPAPARVDREHGVRVDLDGRELRAYLWRNVGQAPWMKKVAGVVVQRRVIAVATELRRNRYGKRVARDICRLIQGADVADFTPGHSVLGHNDVRLRTCRSRQKP